MEITRRRLFGKSLFALITVVMMLSGPALSMTLPLAVTDAPILVGKTMYPASKVRSYVDQGDWPMYLHDAAHGGSTSSPVPVDNTTIWTVDLGTAIPTSPVVVNNTVLVATASGIAHALNASTGIEAWSSNLGSANPSTAAVWNGHVIFGTQSGDLVSLSLKNGSKQWSVNLGAAANTTPIASNGVVYTGTAAGKVWAYNITDHKELWNQSTAYSVRFSVGLSDKVLVASSGDTLEAFNASTGAPLWSNMTGGTDISGPMLSGSSDTPFGWLCYVSSNDGYLYAYNITNGYLRWKSPMSYARPLTPTKTGFLVLTSGLDRVQAFNYSNGNRYWNFTVGDSIVTPPSLGNGNLVVGTKTSLNVTPFSTLSAGPTLWAYAIKNLNSPALAYGRTFVSTTDGKIIAFGHRSLAVLDMVTPDPVSQTAPLMLKGHGTEAPSFVSYRWTSSIDGLIAEGPSKDTAIINSPLSLGTHTLSFQVQDDNWTWSEPVAGQVTVTTSSDWPMFRGNNLRNAATNSKVPTTNGTKWAVDLTADNQELTGSPIIVGNLAFIGTRDGVMHSVNLSNGEELWAFRTNSNIDSTPAYSNGFIFFGSGDSRIYCMDADPSDGADEGTPDPIGSAYDLVWSFDANGPVFSSLTVINNIVYFTTSAVGDVQHPNPGRLYALNADPDALVRELWHFSIPNNVPSYSSPLVYGNLVVFGANDNRVYAINRWSGKEAWNFTTGDSVWSSPAAANGLIYVGSNDWKVYAIYASNGSLAWFKATGDRVQSSPAVANNVVYAGSFDNTLYALNATTGAKLWTYDAKDSIWSSPAVSRDQVVFGSYNGNIHVVNTTTHALTWLRFVGRVTQSSPAISTDTILIGSTGGILYALGKAPDLSVEPKDVTFSLSTPQVGVPMTIKISVWNKGTVHGNGTIEIFDGTDLSVLIGTAHVELDPANSTTLSIPWVPSSAGLHNIVVNITNIKPHDSNPANNKVLKGVTVLAQTEGWRMFHKDAQHTGQSDLAAPNNNKLLWSYAFSGYIRASPVSADQLVFMGTSSGIYAMVEDPGQPTGYIYWSNTTIKNIEATPALINGVVYVASMDGNLYAIDAWNHQTLWTSSIFAGPSSPVVYNGTIYIGTTNGKLLAIGALNGTTLWEKTLGGQILGSPAVYSDKVVVVGNSNGAQSKISCFNLTTGKDRWTYTTGFDVVSSPTLDGAGFVYISDTNGTVYKFEAVPDFKDDGIPNSGSYDIIWAYPVGMPIQSTLALSSNNLYLTAGNTTILSLTTSGELNWKRVFTGDENKLLVSSPTISQNKIFVGGDRIYCLDRSSGLKVWSYDTGVTVKSSPAITLGKVFFASESGGVYAFANITLANPKAVITSPTNNAIFRNGEPISFDGSDSTDDGVILKYTWDFSDGNSATGMTVTHTFDSIGNYTIKLTVEDNEIQPLTNSTYITIQVKPNAPPSLSLPGLNILEADVNTNFNFTITYSDPNNDPPQYVQVSIDAVDYQMQQVFKDADDYQGGVRFYCSTKLPSGNFTYQFETSDGILKVSSSTGKGPKVWQTKDFVKDEIKVTMYFVGQGEVSIEPPTLPPKPPTGYMQKHSIWISTKDVNEWKWMILTINGTGRNLTDDVTYSSLNIFWYNGLNWTSIKTDRIDTNHPVFWINVTSDQTPSLGLFALMGQPAKTNLPPTDYNGPKSMSKNVKSKVTVQFSARDPENGYIYWNINWGDKTPSTGWINNTTANPTYTLFHTYAKKGTYKVIVQFSDDKRVQNASTISSVPSEHILSKTFDITVREEGSSEALIILVVIILVVLAVAFAVPIKGGKEDDEDEEKDDEPIKPTKDEEEVPKGKAKGKAKLPAGGAAEEE
jgi:outer membrane protein assembly factor BamB/PKD repeat protein